MNIQIFITAKDIFIGKQNIFDPLDGEALQKAATFFESLSSLFITQAILFPSFERLKVKVLSHNSRENFPISLKKFGLLSDRRSVFSTKFLDHNFLERYCPNSQ